ncbi:MAG: universal stress protein [Rhodothermales bacterium]
MSDQQAATHGKREKHSLNVRRIVVPTDLSPIADEALARALEIARPTGASIEVLTVLGQVDGDSFNPIRYSPEASARKESSTNLLRESLHALVARHDTEGVQVSVSVRKGRPLHTVLTFARRERADLLVVGTHDRGVLHHFLVGSMAEELVRRAPCSVLVVHERDERPAAGVRSVLVPVDLSEATGHLLRYAATVTMMLDARMNVVHVVEPIPVLDTFSGAMTLRDMVPDMKKHSAAELQKMLDRIDLSFFTDGGDYGVFVDEGHAASSIVDRSKREEADLIIIGKRGRSAIERFFIGSVTERVVRHAPCPVLVVETTAP